MKKYKNARHEKRNKFGYRTFYCQLCDEEFHIDWETIFDIQETTHGYVGFHTNDVYISCPKCGTIVNDKGELGDDNNSNEG